MGEILLARGAPRRKFGRDIVGKGWPLVESMGEILLAKGAPIVESMGEIVSAKGAPS